MHYDQHEHLQPEFLKIHSYMAMFEFKQHLLILDSYTMYND